MLQHRAQAPSVVRDEKVVAINAIVDYGKHIETREPAMSSVTIRNLEPAVKERLRVRAARNGRSMEAELRAIITDAVEAPARPQVNLAEAIRRRFAPFGGVDLDLPPRTPMRKPPTFE